MSILKVANIHFETVGTNRIDYLGDDKVRINSGNGTVFSGATNDALLRITQTGTGHALLVEDSANPDTSPFVIDANGNVGIGTSIFPNKVNLYTNANVSVGINSGNPRATWSFGISPVGSFSIYSNDSQPIVFSNAALERARIDTSGNVLIGRTDSTVGLDVKLDVNGAINCSNIFVNGNAVGGGASITVTDQSSVDPLQYLTFSTTTSGTASSLNVATTKLTFNVATGTLSSTVFNSTSDINQKENITLVTDSLDIIDALNGVRFTWKDNGLPSLGVIAQEVEKVLPELVSDEKSVNYNGLIAVLIQAVKELKAEIEVLKNR